MSASASASAEPKPIGELARLAGVVWSPGEAFRDIAARPRWWPPLALIVVMSLVFTYLVSQRVGWERVVRQQIETSQRTQNLTADQKEQAISQGSKFAAVIGYVVSLVGIPLMAAIVAGVFLLVFKSMMGAELSFRQAFAIVSYAWLPLLFATIMAVVVLFLKNPDEFDIQYPTLTNIGAFLDPQTTSKWLLSLATSIDVFTLWILALLATGFSAAAKKISWASALSGVVGAWVVLVLFKMGWAAMFG